MQRVPKNFLFEINLRVRKPVAECGLEVLSGVHRGCGFLGWEVIRFDGNPVPGGATGFNGPSTNGCGCVATALLGSRCHAIYLGKNAREMANPFLMR